MHEVSSHLLTYQHPVMNAPDGPVRSRVSLVFEGPAGIQAASLTEGTPLVVGRSEPADVVIEDRSLSRSHARFALQGGLVQVEDLRSTNGLRLAGERVEHCVLDEGESIELGAVKVLVSGLARSDDLRAIGGFTAFRHALKGEIQRAQVFGRPFCLAAIRTAAHDGGLERTLSRLLRSVDVGTAYMPGLALVVLPETALADGLALVTRLVQRVGASVSAAVAAFPDDGADFEQLIEVAVHTALGAKPGAVARPERAQTAARPAGPVVVSEATQRLYALIERIARTTMPVLVLGETGSGKELASRAVHERSPRSGGPFVAMNCASIPGNLIESVLFGHEKGAFTGAAERRAGVFEQAHGGSVFLDEVGELPGPVQAALLRVLETKRVTRVGGSREIEVDVRVIAATHRDLPQMVASGDFREDLMFRLDALSLRVPPLRERADEVEPLAELFLEGARKAWKLPVRSIGREARAVLRSYRWPGNVRQLKNVIERAAVVCTGDEIGVDDLPEALTGSAPAPMNTKLREPVLASADAQDEALSLTERVDAFEAALIRAALAKTGGNQTKAAVLLKIPRRTLTNKIHALGIDAR